MSGFGAVIRGLGAGAKSLKQSREEQRQRTLEEAIAKQQGEDRSRKRTLEDAMLARQNEADEYQKSQRPLERQSLEAKIAETQAQAAERRASIPVAGQPRPMTPAQQDVAEQRKFSRSQSMTQDYKSNPTVKAGYDLARVAGGIKAGLSGDSPMDDLSLIYETVKLFDPNSVVREGEIKLMGSAQSLPLQLRMTIERWNSGKLLTPGMRAHIASLVDRKVGESERAVQPVQSEYGKMARRYGVDSDSSFIAPSPFEGVKRRALPNQDY